MELAERRAESRLRLAYPIRLRSDDDAPPPGGAPRRTERTVTQDLSARGAYFSTFGPVAWRVGERVGVVISVPHRLPDSADDVVLDLRAEASVVRVERPGKSRVFGEDGLVPTGVAVQFSEPLRFRYGWI